MPDWASEFDGSLEVRPPLTDEQLSAVPARRGVVLLAGEGDRPIVLLTAADVRARLATRLAAPTEQERRKTPNLRGITTRILWKLAFSHFEADLAYFELARSVWAENFEEMLAWRPAWFVHVDAGEPCPHFERTRQVLGAPGLYLGPFGDGRSAGRFVDIIQDAFDLCRDVQVLRRSPRGQPCAYRQMGRCLGPCDGSISMDEYWRVVAGAAAFAAGERDRFLAELQARMREASAAMEFERASAVKRRLERLSELDGPAFAHVAPAERFRFIIVQAGRGRRELRAFLADRGLVQSAGAMKCPPEAPELSGMLARMGELAGQPRQVGQAERWRIGLVAHYLFLSGQRRGLLVRWTPALTPEALAGAIQSSAAILRVGPGRASKA